MFSALLKITLINFIFLSFTVLAQTQTEDGALDDQEFIDKLELELGKHQAIPQDSKSNVKSQTPKKRVIRKVRNDSSSSSQNSNNNIEPVRPTAKQPQLYVPESKSEPKAPDTWQLEKTLRSSDSFYGRYRIGLGVSTLEFSDKQFSDLYKKMYDNNSYYPKLSVSWIPIDSVVGAGLRWSVGYYSDTGKAPDKNSTIDNIVLTDTKVRFKMFPLQLGAVLQYTPLSWKWFGFEGWYGFERVYHSESFPKSGSGSKVFLTKGHKDFMFYGGSANFSLNFLDERSVNSMRSTLGIGRIYMSLLFEQSSKIGNKPGLKLDRSSYGAAFTFESYM